jgi:RNA polymerase sigma-70 factor (ECF subfamily)
VGDRDAAHDIAAEAFARLLSKWITVRDPKGYLYVTASNLVRDRWRREQRDRKLQARLEETTTVSTPGVRPLDARPGRAAARAPAHPVLLHYWADMSVAEIASALHKPEGTVKRMLHDARHRLHGWLEEDQ